MNIEDKAYFAANENSEALKQALAELNLSVSNVTKHDQENEMFLVNGVWYYYKTTPSGKYKTNSVRRSTYSKPVEDKAYFDRRIEVETWKSPKGTTLIAGLDQGSSGLFQPFVTATYLDGGQQLMTMNPPKFKTEGGARKWLSAEITRRKTPNARKGFKARFANRGAFAEASSSPVLGSLLEKKVMPEGGWRAVETDGAALVIAFEDGDIAGNFARRAAENGYSATAPMAMAGRYWNVKVQNENKQ